LYFRNARVRGSDGEVVVLGEPRMNEQGINDILGMIASLTNQVAILSNFETREIESLMELLSDTLCMTLMVNKRKYGITNTADLNMINQSTMSVAFITIKRGYLEGEKKFWKGSVQEIKSTVENVGSGGFSLGKLNPFKK